MLFKGYFIYTEQKSKKIKIDILNKDWEKYKYGSRTKSIKTIGI